MMKERINSNIKTQQLLRVLTIKSYFNSGKIPRIYFLHFSNQMNPVIEEAAKK